MNAVLKGCMWLIVGIVSAHAMEKPPVLVARSKSSPRIERLKGSPRPGDSPSRTQENIIPSLACLAASCFIIKVNSGTIHELIVPSQVSCVREVILREIIKPHIFPLAITESQNKKSVYHNGVCGIEYVRQTNEVVSGTHNGSIVFCDKNNLAAGTKYELPGISTSTLFMSDRPSREIFIGADNGLIYRMGYDSKTIERSFKAHDLPVIKIRLAKDLIASCSNDKTVKLWDGKTNEPKGIFKNFEQAVRCIEFYEDAANLISGSSEGSLKLWNIDYKDMIAECFYPESRIWGLGLFKKSHRVAVGLNTRYSYGRLSLVDMLQFKEISQWLGHTKTISSLSCDADEKYFVTGSWDCTARLWDSRMQACAANMEHADWVQQVTCIGNEILSGSRDGMVRLWDIRKLRAMETQNISKIITLALALKGQPMLKEPQERTALLDELIAQ